MPAISAANNPIAAIAPPASAANGKAGGRRDDDQPSFSAVLASRTEGTSEPQAKPQARQTTGPAPNKSPANGERNSDNRTKSASEKDAATEPATVATAANATTPTEAQTPQDQSVSNAEADPVTTAILALLAAAQPVATVTADNPAVTPTSVIAATASTAAAATTVPTDSPLADFTATLAQASSSHPNDKLVASQDIAVPTAKLAVLKDEPSLTAGNNPLASSDVLTANVNGNTSGTLDVTAALHVAKSAAPTTVSGPTTLTPPAAAYAVNSPLGSSHWSASVGNSVLLMNHAGQQRAELVLTPPDLGRIEVSITMKGDEASATFVSANPVVRDALENALPRLREILADAGISLGQTQVGAESQHESTADRQSGDNVSPDATADTTDEAKLSAGARLASQRSGVRSLVDTYA